MRIGAFVGTFSNRTDVPIDPVDDVLRAVQEIVGPLHKIETYADPLLDSGVVRGYIEQYVEKDGDGEIKLSRITYSTDQSVLWQRLVQVKEILHVLDPPEKRVASREDIDRLIDKIRLPDEMADHHKDGPHALNDRLGIAYAVACLFPIASRNLLAPELDAGKITMATIVDLIGIPHRYVAVVMNPQWLDIHSDLVKLK